MSATASRRQYLTVAELQEYADITVTDAAEAYDQISQAEELIDAYVGPQQKAVMHTLHGQVSSVAALVITDTHGNTPLYRDTDYFKGCEIEIIGGTGAGQRRTISESAKEAKSITVSEAWTTAPDTTSVFRIYQLGKFPRQGDGHNVPGENTTPPHIYRFIPEAVRRATAAQVEYMIQMGADYFSSDQSDKQSESIGNYAYSKGGGNAGSAHPRVLMTAPKARALLRGIKNSTGRLIVGAP